MYKESISAYRKISYVSGLNGHTEYTSANALRNSIPLAIDMNTSTDRFKPLLRGGYFSNT